MYILVIKILIFISMDIPMHIQIYLLEILISFKFKSFITLRMRYPNLYTHPCIYQRGLF